MDEDTLCEDYSTQSNSLNIGERKELEYLKKRDPMKEFFSLVSCSNVLNISLDLEIN
jgi:hypothetical protein